MPKHLYPVIGVTVFSFGGILVCFCALLLGVTEHMHAWPATLYAGFGLLCAFAGQIWLQRWMRQATAKNVICTCSCGTVNGSGASHCFRCGRKLMWKEQNEN